MSLGQNDPSTAQAPCVHTLTGVTNTASNTGPLGYVCHYDPDHTSEGLGSHARGTLFPLIHVALTLNLKPIMMGGPFHTNLARDYSKLDLAAFLELETTQESLSMLEATCCVVQVNTWSDSVVGSACGDAVVLANLIYEYLQTTKSSYDKPLLLYVNGSFRYQNPTRRVLHWLQQYGQRWKQEKHQDAEDNHRIRIVAHVRVPEEFCPQFWKDDNHIDKLLRVLDAMDTKTLLSHATIHVYTEHAFSHSMEQRLISRNPMTVLHRGNTDTLVDDIRGMAVADIFIPSSSHLSALVAYFLPPQSLVVLSDSARWEYFRPHRDLGCRIIECPQNDVGFHVDLPYLKMKCSGDSNNNHENGRGLATKQLDQCTSI